MQIVDKITVTELSTIAEKMYGNLIKGVVDVKKNMLILDLEMHVDGEQKLLETGSLQNDLWGINLYPLKFGTDDFIEFDSLINIRPRQMNTSRDVEDPDIRKQITALINQKVTS